jgi:hypothetical protein
VYKLVLLEHNGACWSNWNYWSNDYLEQLVHRLVCWRNW